MSDYINKFISNPIYSVAKIFKRSKTTHQEASESTAASAKPSQEIVKQVFSLSYEHLPKNSRNLIRLAGFSGFLAICASAYGAHTYRRSNPRSDLKELYNTAQYYHLIHSVALFGLPLVKRPIVVRILVVNKILLFMLMFCFRHVLYG